ncbi:MAG: STAS domain-containing protein [Candidatus Kapabacteria bacterium]|nr:STAS domain-containing protein [Ignavibacteriota bacterium]MCW5884568.1 STAS domain-containing protein [Candidatus Kapabacteria bacterium]
MSEQLNIKNTDDGYTVLELNGRLVPGTEPEISDVLKQTVDDLCGEGKIKILIDLRNVDYMASNAIGALMTMYNSVMNAGGRLVLWRPKTYLHDSLKLVRVDKLLTITNNFNEAMAYLGIEINEE